MNYDTPRSFASILLEAKDNLTQSKDRLLVDGEVHLENLNPGKISRELWAQLVELKSQISASGISQEDFVELFTRIDSLRTAKNTVDKVRLGGVQNPLVSQDDKETASLALVNELYPYNNALPLSEQQGVTDIRNQATLHIAATLGHQESIRIISA